MERKATKESEELEKKNSGLPPSVRPSPRWSVHSKVKLFCLVLLLLGATLGLVFGLLRVARKDIERPSTLYALSSNKLPYFGLSVLKGYNSCSKFRDDLEAAAKFIIDVEIDKNARSKFHSDWTSWMGRGGIGGKDSIMETTMFDETNQKDASDGTGLSGGEDSYGTNNQVEGVDEADLIKSDGKVVYAAYGDQIVVWNATSGIELSRTTLPSEDEHGTPLCKDDENAQEDIVRKKCYMDYSWRKGLTISSFLLHGTRLVVIATASYDLQEGEDNDETFSILDGYHRTRVFTYDVTSMPIDKSALTLLARKDLQGLYQTARSIDQNAHIVTRSYVRTWNALVKYIDPWNKKFNGLLENEYRQAAYENVMPYISTFAETLAAEIVYSHGGNIDSSESECSEVAKIALMLHKRDDGNSVDDLTTSLSFTDEGILKDFVQVHSFDILESFDDSNNDEDTQRITTTHTGVFIPTASYTSAIYSSDKKLIITGNAYSENEDHQWEERTVLLAFDLNDGAALFHSVGEVPGSVLNQFSIDLYHYNDNGEDYIRIATTNWAQFGIVDDEWRQTLESSNQVTILKLPSNETDKTNMEIAGQVSGMGVGERIYSARFVGDFGFVVTFRQTDPFYTLNLTTPSNPEVVGELKIPGFSNYLQPVNDDLILALGQDANDEGVLQGLQIAMFNVSDFTNPKQIHKYVESGYSSSDAQYDHKAFRYLPESKLLIVPVSIYPYMSDVSFDGFVVYDVDESKNKFSKLFSISHENKDVDYCWDNSYLPSRSLVFDGKVTTTKGHTVFSHDLQSFAKIWDFNLDSDRDADKDRCHYWFEEFVIIN